MHKKRVIAAWNEWGRLKEAAIGRIHDAAEPGYIEELIWLSDEGKSALKRDAGKLTRLAYPEKCTSIQNTLDSLARVLEEHGVTVHRTDPIPEEYTEESEFLSSIQPGNYTIGGADFFRVIGNRMILLNSFRYPFRRKSVWSVRRMIEPIIEDSGVVYFATPPPSPHYTKDDLYIENGDIMIDGHNVYVGISGNATSEKGIAWLTLLLGDEYRVHTVRLSPDRFHLDWVLTLNRPGLLTWCPEAFIDELPPPLAKWDRIAITSEEVAGANNLSIDESTIVVAAHHHRIADEYSRRGMKVVTIPAEDTIMYGSGPRCLTAVISREP